MAKKGSQSSQDLVEQAYQQIQSLLYHRGLTNTETYSDVTLAETLSMSRTPIRAALTILENEGLLQRVPGKGWSTIPLTITDVNEIFYLKEVLECRVAYEAAARISPESAQAVQLAMDDLKKATETGDLEAWLSADYRFHQLLFDAAGNERLQRFITQLDNQWYHFLVAHILAEGSIAAMYDEHRRIADAVVAHDSELAADCMCKALRQRRTSIEKLLTNAQALARVTHPK